MSGTQYVNPNAVYAGGLSCLQTFPPAYVYQEYADDDNIQAFFQAYNDYADQYLLWFNTLNLPIYTGGIIAGALLDWVAQGLYGMARPSITTGTTRSASATNSEPTNVLTTNSRRTTSDQTLQSTTDDIFRRVLTWNFYKGDGFIFNVQWLKRRVLRFLNGPNGISPVIDNTFAVSVTVVGRAFTITVTTTDTVTVALLGALIQSGACATPFQYTFVVTAGSGATNLANEAGILILLDVTGYPTSSVGLAPGSLWNNSTTISVISGITPNPLASPVFFGVITAAHLLLLGGGNLPLTPPGSGTGIIWNNGGILCVA